MRAKFLCLTILLSVIIIAPSISIASSAAFADANIPAKHAPDRLLIKFKANISDPAQNAILEKNKAAKTDEIPQINIKIIKVPENSLDSLVCIMKEPPLEYVEKDYPFHARFVPFL